VVPGAGQGVVEALSEADLSFFFLSFFLSPVSLGGGVQLAVEAASLGGVGAAEVEAGVSPATGLVPGAG